MWSATLWSSVSCGPMRRAMRRAGNGPKRSELMVRADGLVRGSKSRAPAWRKAWPNARREGRQFLSQVVETGRDRSKFPSRCRRRRFGATTRGFAPSTCGSGAKTGRPTFCRFPMPKAPLGGMALALETLEKEAAQQGKAFVNHVKHMILHGFLHLLGHDHQTKADARLMERLEIAILGAKWASPILT